MSKGHAVLLAETSILGAMITTPDFARHCVSKLKVKDFSTEPNQLLFQTYEEAVSQGGALDVNSLSELIEKAGRYKKIGGMSYISSILAGTTSLDQAVLDTHIDLVRSASKRRSTVVLLEEARQKVDDWSVSPEDLWDQLNRDAFSAVMENERKGFTHIFTGAQGNLYDQRMQILREREGRRTIYTGINPWDDLIPGGFPRGDISVLAGRPGMGKSAIRANITYSMLNEGAGVILVSTEQTKEAETDRLDSIVTGIPLTEITRSQFWPEDDERLDMIKEANRQINERWNYDMVFSRSMTFTDMWEFFSIVTRRAQKDIIFIDLFDRLSDVNVSQNKPQLISQKLGELGAMAEYFDVHICVLVQIRRDIDRRRDRHPTLADLKDSGNFEEAARLVILLYREAYYNPDSLDSMIEAQVAKQSQGPAGPHALVRFDFLPTNLRCEAEDLLE